MPIKCLSILQPWASLVAAGVKRVETRSWQTAHRGPVLIHAGRRFPPSVRDLCTQEPFHTVLHNLGIPTPASLPKGALLGLITIADVFRTDVLLDGPLKHDPCERALGDYSEARYGWLLTDARPFAAPIPMSGQLGLFTLPQHLTDTVCEVFPEVRELAQEPEAAV